MDASERTRIYRRLADGDEQLVGYLDHDQVIYRRSHGVDTPIGRVDAGRILRQAAIDELEVGVFTADGRVHSHGLFTGGDLGWVDPDGVVVQAGLILGEEEVGRVEGPYPAAAAAALLLIFLPAAQEEDRRRR